MACLIIIVSKALSDTTSHCCPEFATSFLTSARKTPVSDTRLYIKTTRISFHCKIFNLSSLHHTLGAAHWSFMIYTNTFEFFKCSRYSLILNQPCVALSSSHSIAFFSRSPVYPCLIPLIYNVLYIGSTIVDGCYLCCDCWQQISLAIVGNLGNHAISLIFKY